VVVHLLETHFPFCQPIIENTVLGAFLDVERVLVPLPLRLWARHVLIMKPKVVYWRNTSVVRPILTFAVLLWWKKTPQISVNQKTAIPHEIVSVNKLFKLFYTIHSEIYCNILMTKKNSIKPCS
jgi:hypothetical protein